MTSRDQRRSLWIVLACFVVGGVVVALAVMPGDPFARYLALAGLLILGAGASIDLLVETDNPVEPRRADKRGFRILRRSMLFALMFIFSLFVFPLIGLATGGLSAFFLWPQSTLLTDGLARVATDDGARYYEDRAMVGALLFWAVAAAAYGLATWKRSLRLAALLAYPVMIALAVAANHALYLAGFLAASYDWP